MVGIKDMEMPKNCMVCPFCERMGSHLHCPVAKSHIDIRYTESRHPDCTLVEIEERKTGEWIYEYDNGVSAVYHCSVCERKLVVLRDDTVENYPYCHCGAEIRGCEDVN